MDFGSGTSRVSNKWRATKGLSTINCESRTDRINQNSEIRLSKQNDELEKMRNTSKKLMDIEMKNLSTEFVNKQLKLFVDDLNNITEEKKLRNNDQANQSTNLNDNQLAIQKAKNALLTDVYRKSNSKTKSNGPPGMFRQHSLNPNYLVSQNDAGQSSNEALLKSQLRVQRYMQLRRTKSEAMIDEIEEKDKMILQKSGKFISPFLNPGRQMSIDKILKDNCRENHIAVDRLFQSQATSDNRFVQLMKALEPTKPSLKHQFSLLN